MGPAPVGRTGRKQDWEEGESEVEWLCRVCQGRGDWLNLHTLGPISHWMWAALGRGKTWKRGDASAEAIPKGTAHQGWSVGSLPSSGVTEPFIPS